MRRRLILLIADAMFTAVLIAVLWLVIYVLPETGTPAMDLQEEIEDTAYQTCIFGPSLPSGL